MKSSTFALVSLLTSIVVAQPHRHQQIHKKRDVAWVTKWESVTETIDVTETVWVSSGYVPPTTSSEASASTTLSSVSSSSTAEAAGQFYEGSQSSSSVSSSSIYVAPTTSVYETPTPSSTYIAPASTSSTEAPYVAPIETPSSTLSSVYVAPTTSTTPVYVAPTTSSSVYVAPTTAAAKAAATASSSSSSSSGGASSGCTSGTPCSGDITYYEAGLGACGWTNDGSSENVVALPHGLMGTQSNGNPYCGQEITIKCSTTGKTTTAKVVDKCMGCDGDSIDLSNAAFLDLDELSVGRTTAEWWFN